MVSLDDSAAVVTGAASGIGEAIAHELTAHGASVVVADVAEDIHTVADDVTDAGGDAVGTVTDISDPDDIDALVDTAVEEFGTIDVLCNNAGVYDDARSVGDTT
jgi:3-oxoacyl-[acyl-carrier protein] reductase